MQTQPSTFHASTPTIRTLIKLANETLTPTYELRQDAIKGINCHDENGDYLFTLPEWATTEDANTMILVTQAMAEAYATGWEDGNEAGSR